MALNRPTRAALHTTEKIIDRVLCVAGAVLFSQAPEFMQQYLQRLGGALSEAQRQLEQFKNVAAQSGQTLTELVAHSKASTDIAMAKLGGVMEAASLRVSELSTAETAIREASPFTRPFAFLRHVDSQIMQDTWTIFKPAVPTTMEGLMYAAAGLVILLGVYHGFVRYPIARAWQRRQATKLTSGPPAPTPVPPPTKIVV